MWTLEETIRQLADAGYCSEEIARIINRGPAAVMRALEARKGAGDE